MKSRAFLGSSFAIALSSLALLAVAAGACGQDAPTCDSVCALPGATSDCNDSCATAQATCQSAGDNGAFQALLTCVSNAGSYASANTVCSAQAAAVSAGCDGSTGPSGGGGGVTSGGSGTGTGTNAECEALAECCTSLPAASQSGCEAVVSASVAALCEESLQEVVASGFCGSTGFDDAGVGGDDASVGDDAGFDDAGFDDGGIVESDAGFGDDATTGFDAGPPSGCAAGAPCQQGSACTNVGAGPCSSDQQFVCGSNGVFVSDGNTCNGDVSGCGFGSGSCMESCTCTDGQMICSGNCVDAG